MHGVTIQLPETVLIDPEVTAGEDTVIEPGVQLLGKTKIGARCMIRASSVLSDAILGDDVDRRAALRRGAEPPGRRRDDRPVRAAAAGQPPESQGAHRQLRGAEEDHRSAKAPRPGHLTYLGDAKLGAKSNIGAGTITCNYDGFNKHPTTIGSRVFIGSNTALVAPVRLGDGAYIAAGSTITDNVPAEGLGIARGRQANKPGWAAKKRRELAALKARHIVAEARAQIESSQPRKSAKKTRRR